MNAAGPREALTPTERDLRHHVRTHWKAYALQGGAQLLLGFLAVAAPFAATFATVLFFGLILVAAGAAGLVGAFTMRGPAGRGSTLALSILVLLLGVVVLADPFAGAVSLTVMIALYFLLASVANFALARALRNAAGRSTLLFAAAGLNVVLAVFLVVGLPGDRRGGDRPHPRLLVPRFGRGASGRRARRARRLSAAFRQTCWPPLMWISEPVT